MPLSRYCQDHSFWAHLEHQRFCVTLKLEGKKKYYNYNLSGLQTLLDLGASPDYKDARGLTPLYYSVSNDTSQLCTEMLLHERAYVGTHDDQGWCEIHQVGSFECAFNLYKCKRNEESTIFIKIYFNNWW